MFRQEEVFVGSWQDKTIDSMQRRRFENAVISLPPLGAQRLEELSASVLTRTIERSWQSIERKPMIAQQLAHIRSRVLKSISAHADCLSCDEHDLVERALILNGSAQIEDARELEAAQALSLRLWASLGLVSGRPYIEMNRWVMEPAARAMERDEHREIRNKLDTFNAGLSALLYRIGMIDDRIPQQRIARDVIGRHVPEDQCELLARRYLWASYDCMDYCEGVMLLHPALAEPDALFAKRINKHVLRFDERMDEARYDILPEEVPAEERLIRVIKGALRSGMREDEVARNIRYLCKQGAPLWALEEVLQSTLIVLLTRSMKGALENMFYTIPKWIESGCCMALQ